MESKLCGGGGELVRLVELRERLVKAGVPAEQLVIERELLGPLPSLRASIGRQVTRKVDRLSCVRFASARYSVPVRLIGTEVRLRTDDGRLLVIVTGHIDLSVGSVAGFVGAVAGPVGAVIGPSPDGV